MVWRSADGVYEVGGLPACIEHLRTDRWPADLVAGLIEHSIDLDVVMRESCPVCQGEGRMPEHVH